MFKPEKRSRNQEAKIQARGNCTHGEDSKDLITSNYSITFYYLIHSIWEMKGVKDMCMNSATNTLSESNIVPYILI